MHVFYARTLPQWLSAPLKVPPQYQQQQQQSTSLTRALSAYRDTLQRVYAPGDQTVAELDALRELITNAGELARELLLVARPLLGMSRLAQLAGMAEAIAGVAPCVAQQQPQQPQQQPLSVPTMASSLSTGTAVAAAAAAVSSASSGPSRVHGRALYTEMHTLVTDARRASAALAATPSLVPRIPLVSAASTQSGGFGSDEDDDHRTQLAGGDALAGRNARPNPNTPTLAQLTAPLSAAVAVLRHRDEQVSAAAAASAAAGSAFEYDTAAPAGSTKPRVAAAAAASDAPLPSDRDGAGVPCDWDAGMRSVWAVLVRLLVPIGPALWRSYLARTMHEGIQNVYQQTLHGAARTAAASGMCLLCVLIYLPL